MLIAGIDLAWQTRKNPTAMAIGTVQGGELVLNEIATDLFSVDSILRRLDTYASLQGIAIDAPLVIPNQTGQRVCEQHLSRAYGARKASCHASNTTLYPNSDSVLLAQALEIRGFRHLGMASEKWQLECYPHPALIEIFDLKERHLYKKGRVSEKKKGQVTLGKMLLALAGSKVLSLRVPTELRTPFDDSHIQDLAGLHLKRNEDVLDAVICLYVAGLYASEVTMQIFGDATTGYIYVPQPGRSGI